MNLKQIMDQEKAFLQNNKIKTDDLVGKKNGPTTWAGTSQETIQMANKQIQRCSTSWVFREMQIKTTVRYNHILNRMAKIKIHGGGAENMCGQGYGATGMLKHCWWDVSWHNYFGKPSGSLH